MSKKLKNLVSVTAITMVILLSTSTAVFAQSSTPTEFQNELVNHMRNRETSFSIKYTGDANTFISQASALIKNATKSDEYLDLSFTNENCSATGITGNLNVDFKIGYITTLAQEKVVDQKVPQIVSSVITPGMTDFQKAQALHDYVCNIASYDYSLQKTSAYNILVDGKSVCRGYALLLYRLYKEAGLPAHIVVGTLKGESHAWNIVQLGGNWYHVDATNDDANNFLKFYGMSDSTAKSYGFSWTQGSLPSASSNLIMDALTRATKAVTDAETYKTQIYVDTANNLVSALQDGTNKTALQQRLSVVQNLIVQADTAAVVNAESAKTQASIDSALKLVNTLPASDAKTSLLNRLKSIKLTVQQSMSLNNATTAVNNAEKYLTQSYVEIANKAITLLNDSDSKTALISRMQAVSQKMLQNANASVVKVESSLSQIDQTNAEKLVLVLPNGTDKTALRARLDATKLKININNATRAVVNAENNQTQLNVTIAQSAINELIAGSDKTALKQRLQVVQKAVNLSNATLAVANAENYKTQYYIEIAARLVSVLEDGSAKTSLTARLQAVEQQAIYLSKAKIAVQVAEKVKTTTSISNAKQLIAKLNDGADKTNLTNRVNVIVPISQR